MSSLKAMVLGCGGQDGRHLTELLLEKGYEVHGTVRRNESAGQQMWRYNESEKGQKLLEEIHLHYMDLLDYDSVSNVMKEVQPDEIYHLAAVSFVPVSWEDTATVLNTNVFGTYRVLEAMRQYCKHARLVNAASSEMYGSAPAPQNETTFFEPRSPYATSKVGAHYLTRNYRESYNMFCANSICFNHECFLPNVPIIIFDGRFIDIIPVQELHVSREREKRNGTKKLTRIISQKDLFVWDKNGWTKIKTVTMTKNKSDIMNYDVYKITARGAFFEVTENHKINTIDKKIQAKDINIKDNIKLLPLPKLLQNTDISPLMAKFIGFFVAEGYAQKDCENREHINGKLSNTNKALLEKYEKIWNVVTCGDCAYSSALSGFGNKPTYSLNLKGGSDFLHWLRKNCYTIDGYKRVPKIILNSKVEVIDAFLSGYNDGDGLKASRYKNRKYQGFKTNSSVLAAGLWFLASNIMKAKLTLNVDYYDNNNFQYYSINIGNPDGLEYSSSKVNSEIKKIVIDKNFNDFVYDIETESGTLHAGIGNGFVCNSKFRGPEFVTRKISMAVAKIKNGTQKELILGNLDAKRDWGNSEEYVEAMWKMLQQDEPDDFVIATGETHTVSEFVSQAFWRAGLDNWKEYVQSDKSLYRPAEVPLLLGNPSKANEKLKWKAKTLFPELVNNMVDADMERVKCSLL